MLLFVRIFIIIFPCWKLLFLNLTEPCFYLHEDEHMTQTGQSDHLIPLSKVVQGWAQDTGLRLIRVPPLDFAEIPSIKNNVSLD